MTSNINKDQWSYINAAIAEALKSDMPSKHGCVIVKNGNIISRGFNKYMGYDKYGKSLKHNKVSIHAEASAIKNCNTSDLSGANLYVIRYHTVNNTISNSKPCQKCDKLIRQCMKKYNLKTVYYSLNLIQLSD